MSEVVYYNAEIINNNDFPIACVVNDIRGQPIITNPEEWDLSIVRWDLDSSLIPPCGVAMDAAATPSNPLTTCKVRLVRGVDIVEQTVLLYPNQNDGFFFSYNALIEGVNAAFATAYSLLSTPSATSPPFFSFSGTTELITIYFSDTYYTSILPPVYVEINAPLQALFNNFPYLAPANGWFRFYFQSPFSVVLPPTGARYGYPVSVNLTSGNVFALSQQFACMSKWMACKSVYITTSSIPVVNENLPSAISSGAQNQNTSMATSAIITDFSTTSLQPLDANSHISYLPSAEYRRVSLRGKEPLNRINLEVFWTTFKGATARVMIPPNGYFSAKLCFERKRGYELV